MRTTSSTDASATGATQAGELQQPSHPRQGNESSMLFHKEMAKTKFRPHLNTDGTAGKQQR